MWISIQNRQRQRRYSRTRAPFTGLWRYPVKGSNLIGIGSNRLDLNDKVFLDHVQVLQESAA